MVLDIIRQTITEYNLLKNGDRVLVGLSGGADSVCLTYALAALSKELGVTVFAAHLNHGIRGEEAKRDETAAKMTAETLGISFFSEYADIPFIANNTGKSEETAAREIRYDFFERIANENGINKIATAHNKNDNAETILMHFIRGGSLTGLCGIPYKRGSVIRPLLDVSREQVEEYCSQNGLKFVTDSTNLQNDYTRNKLRNIFIPQILNNFNSNFIETVTSNSRLIFEDNDFIDKCAQEAYDMAVQNNVIDIEKLNKYALAIKRRVIRLVLKEHYGTLDGISSQFIKDIIALTEKDSGKSINLPNDTIVKNEYGKIIITKSAGYTEYFEYSVKIGDTVIINEIKKKITVSETKFRKNDGAVYLGCHGLDKITVRNRKEGDCFNPSGMNGTKKVKEYFINKKIPREERDKVPIVEINGHIAAVGKRADEKFLFKDSGIRIDFFDI